MPELDAAFMDTTFVDFPPRNVHLIAAASPYTVEELIRAFTRQRQEISVLISNLDDEQINYNPDPTNFSISEVVSHMVTAQNGTYNALLELSQIILPFIDHVSFMPGAGAKKSLSAASCTKLLNDATEELIDLMRQSARTEHSEPKDYPVVGLMDAKAWILFQLGHDVDHLRQTKAVLHSEGFPRRDIKVGLPQNG